MDAQSRTPPLFSLEKRGTAESYSVFMEIWLFLRATGKWWLVPILLALLALGALALLSGTAYAPFIYTLF